MTTNELLPDLSPGSIAAFKARFDAADDETALDMWSAISTQGGYGELLERAAAVHPICWRRITSLFKGPPADWMVRRGIVKPR